MSATRPATEFSIGSMASAARPSRTAAMASSNVSQGSVVERRKDLAAGEIGIGAGRALEGDDAVGTRRLMRAVDPAVRHGAHASSAAARA